MGAENNIPHSWYRQGVGIRFIAAEEAELRSLLPTLYGYHLVFVGEPGLACALDASLISHRLILSAQQSAIHGQETIAHVKGTSEILPFRSDSIDVLVLSHALEQANNPHEVLREAHRVLIPEGHLVITGFNPYSMWGLWQRYQRATGTIRSAGKLLGLNRVRDWLKLLNFQITGGKMFYFRPPVNNANVNDKLAFMEHWGEHGWPFWGGAYTLVAVKRVVPFTPIRVKRAFEKSIWQPAPQAIPKPTTTAQSENES